MTRRDFILSGAAALAAGCAGIEPKESKLSIIDTHTHFYDPARPGGVPWPPQNDAVLYRRVLPGELKTIAQPLGVKGTVVVEASPLVEDNAWVLGLAAHQPFILGLVGHLRPGTRDFSEQLKRFADNPLFRGIRIGGWDIPMAPERSDYVRDLGLLADRGLSVDVLGGPDQLPKIAALARAVPDLQIVINHCAGVHIDGGTLDHAWVGGIRLAAFQRNVSMKASGLAEGTGREFKAPADLDFYRPVLDLLWNEFGEDRLIFGSNWPVSARFADYPAVLKIVQDYFMAKGLAAARKYFETNAQRVYKVRLIA